MKKFFKTAILILILVQQLKTYSQNVAIELTNMHVLYKYVPNLIKIVVQNTPPKNVIIKTKVGTLKRLHEEDSCLYYYWCSKCNVTQEQITIGVRTNYNINWIDSTGYGLKEDAKKSILIKIRGCIGDCVQEKEYFKIDTIGDEIIPPRLSAPTINYDFDVDYKVIKYSVEQIRNNSIIYRSLNIVQDEFTRELSNKIEESKSGDKFKFFDVYVGFDNCEEVFEGMTITIK